MDKYQKLKNEYKEIYNQVTDILLKHDPIGIFFGDNTDEYDPEVSTILPKLKDCESEKDVLELVYRVFVKWFDESIAGPKTKYEPVAKEIREIWARRTSNGKEK